MPVKIVGTCRVVDALGDWGTHNTAWRARRQITDVSEGVDFVSTYYSNDLDLLPRIFLASPIGCIRAEIVEADLSKLTLHNGTPVSIAWAMHIKSAKSRGGDRVREMTASEAPVMGPLICTCHAVMSDANAELKPPFVVFDGWTRLAAWIVHWQAGNIYPIAADVILTRSPVLLPQSTQERSR